MNHIENIKYIKKQIDYLNFTNSLSKSMYINSKEFEQRLIERIKEYPFDCLRLIFLTETDGIVISESGNGTEYSFNKALMKRILKDKYDIISIINENYRECCYAFDICEVESFADGILCKNNTFSIRLLECSSEPEDWRMYYNYKLTKNGRLIVKKILNLLENNVLALEDIFVTNELNVTIANIAHCIWITVPNGSMNFKEYINSIDPDCLSKIKDSSFNSIDYEPLFLFNHLENFLQNNGGI